MDEKAKMEARRKKILDNAEARLRFIKEGIPWRNEVVKSNDVSPNVDNKDSIDDKGDSKVTDGIINPPSTEVPDNTQLLEAEQHRLSTSGNELDNVNSESDDIIEGIDSSESLIRHETILPDKPTERPENQKNYNEINDVSCDIPPQPIHQTPINENSDIINQPTVDSVDTSTGIQLKADSEEDPFESLTAFLIESANERKLQKQKAVDRNRLILINYLLMMCLGIFVRISYSARVSWIFNEAMLVPFLTVAIPQIISAARDPPPPTGTMTHLLVISGIKLKITLPRMTQLKMNPYL